MRRSDGSEKGTTMDLSRRDFVISAGAAMTAALGACGSTGGTGPEAEPTGRADAAIVPGVSVVADAGSPTGYTATFAYDATAEEKAVSSIFVTGPFQYVSPDQELTDESNRYTPEQFESGMYATNFAPAGGMEAGWGATFELADEDADGIYTVTFPVSSGSFAYSYVISHEGEEEPVTTDDPANPSPAKDNPDSITPTGDLTHSICYGHWDAKKQADSPNLDFVLPTEDGGTQEYVSYTGSDGQTQYLGIYTPAGYDATREEPYKVVYMSHGGGNETDWFAMGHVDHIMDNLSAAGKTEAALIVTMDNSHYQWDFAQIEDNVLNHVIPFVEERYHVSPEAGDRAFCGLSMGGMTTCNMYFDHPDAFGSFGIWSGTDMTAVKKTEGLDVPKVMLAVGTCDIASETIMPNDDPKALKKYEDLERWATENDMANFDIAGYFPGSHDWFVWSACFAYFCEKVLWK